MALPRKLKHMNLFVDGTNYRGIVEEVTLPKLSRKLEAYRGGGMNGSAHVDLGLEDDALGCEVNFGGIDTEIFKKYAADKVDGILLRFAGSYQQDDTGEAVPVEFIMRGRIKEIDPGNAKQGDNTQMKVSFANSYVKLTINGEEIIELAPLDMIERVDGVDMLEKHKRNIGL